MDFSVQLFLLRNLFEKFFDELLVGVAITPVVGACHVIVAEFSGVIEDEVVRNVLYRSLRKAGLIHDRGVFEVLGPSFCFERGEGVRLIASLAVGSDELEGFVLERFGQTDHARSELSAAASSTPDDEEGDFAFEVLGGFQFGASPVRSPVDTLDGAFDFAVVLLACQNGQAEQNADEEKFYHDTWGDESVGPLFPFLQKN